LIIHVRQPGYSSGKGTEPTGILAGLALVEML
jgi:hypothetical protein